MYTGRSPADAGPLSYQGKLAFTISDVHLMEGLYVMYIESGSEMSAILKASLSKDIKGLKQNVLLFTECIA